MSVLASAQDVLRKVSGYMVPKFLQPTRLVYSISACFLVTFAAWVVCRPCEQPQGENPDYPAAPTGQNIPEVELPTPAPTPKEAKQPPKKEDPRRVEHRDREQPAEVIPEEDFPWDPFHIV